MLIAAKVLHVIKNTLATLKPVKAYKIEETSNDIVSLERLIDINDNYNFFTGSIYGL